jgi:glycine dehydrogenase
MDISNASLLDESTAAAEAMVMAREIKGGQAFFVADDCHPQTIALLRTRAEPLGIRLIVGSIRAFPTEPVFGVLFQYPSTDGVIRDLGPIIERIHGAGALAVVAVDLLALTLIKPPGELGADMVEGCRGASGSAPHASDP